MPYEFQDGQVPTLPGEYDSTNTTLEQDTKEILVNQKAELEHLQYQIEHQEINDKAVSDNLKSINDALNLLVEKSDSGTSSLQDSNTQTQALLQNIDKSLDLQHDTNAVISTWGTIYVPLILVVTMLWWFFRQFINTYK